MQKLVERLKETSKSVLVTPEQIEKFLTERGRPKVDYSGNLTPLYSELNKTTDVEEQKRLILEYSRQNQILESAIKGEQTIEDFVNKVDREKNEMITVSPHDFQGPFYKRHEEYICALGDLITKPTDLRHFANVPFLESLGQGFLAFANPCGIFYKPQKNQNAINESRYVDEKIKELFRRGE